MKLALALLIPALSAFGQSVVGTSGSSSRGPDGTMRGSASFQIMPFTPSTIKNAPYSGEDVTESVQTLVDGTHITRSGMGPHQKTWRDSQGRTHTEGRMGGFTDSNGDAAIVQINDPVGGYFYVLDTVNKVAHRVKMEAPSQHFTTATRSSSTTSPSGVTGVPGTLGVIVGSVGSVGSGVVRTVPVAAGGPLGGVHAMPASTTEDLGTKLIDGVLVSGTRRSTIIPEGQQGNDRPMTTTFETWVSKELQLTVLSINYSPLNGTSTTKVANLSTVEPDPSLFMVPAGYTTVDEKESFTIKWGE